MNLLGFEITNEIINIIMALFTAIASIASLFAVVSANRSNKIAMEQYQRNADFEKDNNRPVLDFAVKDYKMDTTDSFLKDWDDVDNDVYMPKHLSSSYIKLCNVGNKVARNVKVTYFYEGLDEITEFVNKNPEVKFKKEKGTVNGVDCNFCWFSEKSKTKNSSFLFYDLPYKESIGSIHNGNDIKVHLPKLFVYTNNILESEVFKRHNFKINLLLRIVYTDPFNKIYIQRFTIENRIRNKSIGSVNYIAGKLIPIETANIEVEDKPRHPS